MDIRLVTGKDDALVAEAVIPPFQIPFPAIIWGERIFVHKGFDMLTLVYREVTAWTITGQPGNQVVTPELASNP